MLQRFNFIGGQTCPARSGRVLEVIDPADGQPFATIARSDAADIDAAVAAARRAFEGDWGRMTATERGRVLLRWSALVLEHRAERRMRFTAKGTGHAGATEAQPVPLRGLARAAWAGSGS